MSRSTIWTMSVGLPLRLVIVAPASAGIPRVAEFRGRHKFRGRHT